MQTGFFVILNFYWALLPPSLSVMEMRLPWLAWLWLAEIEKASVQADQHLYIVDSGFLVELAADGVR